METRWLDRESAATYIHCRPERIDELVKQGRLPCSVFDGLQLYFIDHLDQVLFSFSLQRDPVVSALPTAGSELAEPTQHRLVSVLDGCLRDEVSKLIAQLKSPTENPDQYGKMLADELTRSLARSDYRSIPANVADRLARWSSPLRDDERTRFVSPLARKISELLFGRILPRKD